MPPRRPGAPGVCPQCGQPLQSAPATACQSVACTGRRRAREAAEAEERRRVARWETGRRYAGAGPAGAEFAVLPGQRGSLVKPPAEAIAAFTRHLEHIAALAAADATAADATAADATAADATAANATAANATAANATAADATAADGPALPTWTPATPWLDAACGACRGACCAEGRTHHAFLTVATLIELRRGGHPDGALPPTELVRDTLARIPEEHVENSCLFHGHAGCTLPRHRRGQKCNRYYCGPMKTADRRVQESGSDRLVAVGLTRTVSHGPGGGRVVAHASDGTDDELVAVGVASAAGFEPVAQPPTASLNPEGSS